MLCLCVGLCVCRSARWRSTPYSLVRRNQLESGFRNEEAHRAKAGDRRRHAHRMASYSQSTRHVILHRTNPNSRRHKTHDGWRSCSSDVLRCFTFMNMALQPKLRTTNFLVESMLERISEISKSIKLLHVKYQSSIIAL